MIEELKKLEEEWRRRARRKAIDAESEEGMARRALEHAAGCYFNCAQELEQAIRKSRATWDYDSSELAARLATEIVFGTR